MSEAGARELPASLPDFVRSSAAVAEIAALGPEADRLKGSGREWDADADPGHFVDLDDDGKLAGVVDLDALPPSREAYDTALRTAGTDQYRAGYLPYELVDGYEQLTTDFAYWRVDRVGEREATSVADRAFFRADRQLREELTVRDIGYWSHYVGDASQPLHVSIHYNGWGAVPNPRGYSNSSTIHARFETALVAAVADEPAVRAAMPAYVPSTAPIQQRIAAYLRASLAGVPTVYGLEAAGAIDAPSPEAKAFVVARLGAAAAMLRDLIADAWRESQARSVGYPAFSVDDVERGAVPVTRAMLAGD